MAKKRTRGIPEPRVQPYDKPLRFSFKHFDPEHYKFHVLECSPDFMRFLLLQLQVFSTWSVETFADQNNKEHRHVIDFDQTSERDGFINVPNIDRDQLGFHEAWQFSVDPAKPERLWRVHGILIDDTFYVIWLDPEHRLYPKPA